MDRVRDDRPFAGRAPPAAVFHYSQDRTAAHPNRHLAGYAGILQADAYAGFNDLYAATRQPGPVTEAACWSHGRRKFFVLAELGKAPIATEAVRRIDLIFGHERAINMMPQEKRLAVRQAQIAPLVTELHAWMRAEREKLSRHSNTAKAMDYMLKRWDAFTRFLNDGRICLTNNAGERAAAIYTLISTAKLNDVDPRAWLADVLRRIAGHPASRLDELLPWNWKTISAAKAA